VNRQKALLIARSECERRGWQWQEPAHVQWGLFNYVVWTNSRSCGGNACIKVRKRDGMVVSAEVTPR
jgi:hypothetical protein